MPSPSKLLVIMIFLFLALFIISHAQSLPGVVLQVRRMAAFRQGLRTLFVSHLIAVHESFNLVT
ncbi:hypothetical protein ISN45_Aa02g025300 [Arabidopsis thaliana x Arabidopsis arenosa]|uniref:Transmembrane protein n=1 Tax=Arabidopsis thaliana x Arabidopsis arenosa TaxID=1240361 RepID=A0A8T2BP46_9BRAS|nr:hypothetical protein ISN45_Aa02g025300 [Arabidopsis thaliana x Arabidopsis arenosa]